MTSKENSEQLDVVDEFDRFLTTLDRATIHRKRLIHRAVHVFLMNPTGEIYLQKRAMTKSEHPGCWDSSASGHVASGESYPDAAFRELEEELNLKMDLEFVCKVPACDETDREHAMLFRALLKKGQAQPVPNPVEIMNGGFFEGKDIQHRIEQEPDQFTPSFRELFRLYRG